eukprot:15365354-Ditylum_brightwellii.AAC.1
MADSQSIEAICVDNDKKSDVPSGTIFNLKYNGRIGFGLYLDSSELFCSPSMRLAILFTTKMTPMQVISLLQSLSQPLNLET